MVGIERIDKGVVMNAIKTKENDVYDPARIGEDIKSIYKTGYFSDVMVDVKDTDKGKAVTFVVVERPAVSMRSTLPGTRKSRRKTYGTSSR